LITHSIGTLGQGQERGSVVTLTHHCIATFLRMQARIMAEASEEEKADLQEKEERFWQYSNRWGEDLPRNTEIPF
jgi:hypothetical protein